MDRRRFITGLVSLVAAPAIVRASSLMHVRSEIIRPKIVDLTHLFEDMPPVHPNCRCVITIEGLREFILPVGYLREGQTVWVTEKGMHVK